MQSLVVFLGNTLAGDDASGYHLSKLFDEKQHTRKLYLGTDLLRLYHEYNGEDRLILVDAVTGISDVIHLQNEEILSLNNKSKHAHFLSAVEFLKILKVVMTNFPKEIHLIGIPAKDFSQKTYSKEQLQKAATMLNKLLEEP